MLNFKISRKKSEFKSAYYKKEIYLPITDKSGNIIGKEERWRIHKNGILHRGFTVVLVYKNYILAQFRKHLIFDGVVDFSFSSHPYYKNSQLINDEQSIIESLKREWLIKNLPEKKHIKFLGKTLYIARDKNGFIEKELDFFYKIELNEMPFSNLDFAYGYILIEKKRFLEGDFHPLNKNQIAPWVKSALVQNIFKNV